MITKPKKVFFCELFCVNDEGNPSCDNLLLEFSMIKVLPYDDKSFAKVIVENTQRINFNESEMWKDDHRMFNVYPSYLFMLQTNRERIKNDSQWVTQIQIVLNLLWVISGKDREGEKLRVPRKLIIKWGIKVKWTYSKKKCHKNDRPPVTRPVKLKSLSHFIQFK